MLTHPYLLSVLAYPAESSPIHRGVFIGRGLLGITLRPPPEAFVPFPAEAHPDLTTRQRIALQTSPAACIGCHGVMNPLGFTLENFDAVGRYRAHLARKALLENDQEALRHLSPVDIEDAGAVLAKASISAGFSRRPGRR